MKLACVYVRECVCEETEMLHRQLHSHGICMIVCVCVCVCLRVYLQIMYCGAHAVDQFTYVGSYEVERNVRLDQQTDSRKDSFRLQTANTNEHKNFHLKYRKKKKEADGLHTVVKNTQTNTHSHININKILIVFVCCL